MSDSEKICTRDYHPKKSRKLKGYTLDIGSRALLIVPVNLYSTYTCNVRTH